MSKRNHLTWSEERDDNRCPTCGRKTLLVIAPHDWNVDEGDSVEVHEEITGHYCPKCQRLRSLSFNAMQ